jgi:prevent-host-death family protein
MRQVTIHEAKTHLSRLLSDVERGEEIVIARASQPIARLVPVGDLASAQPASRRGAFGVDASGWVVPDDFDSPLPPEIQALFE